MKKEIDLVPRDFDLGFAKLHYRGWIWFFFLCTFLWLSGFFISYDFITPGASMPCASMPPISRLYTPTWFLIPFFEIFLVLKNGVWERDNKTWQCVYRGSWNWLLFWALFFFPVAILLFLFKKPLWVGEDIPENTENKSLTNQDK